jgi:hypothetical protein
MQKQDFLISNFVGHVNSLALWETVAEVDRTPQKKCSTKVLRPFSSERGDYCHFPQGFLW